MPENVQPSPCWVSSWQGRVIDELADGTDKIRFGILWHCDTQMLQVNCKSNDVQRPTKLLFSVFMRDTNFVQQTEEMGLIGGHMSVIWCVEGEVFRECNIKCVIHIMEEVFNAKFLSSYPAYQTKEEAP